MNAETSSPSMGGPLLDRICRVTTLDKVALGFAGMFLFCVAAFAVLAGIAIGDAPQGRLWSFVIGYAAIGFVGAIVAPWALCRAAHAAAHAARIAREQRTERTTRVEPLAVFMHGRVA